MEGGTGANPLQTAYVNGHLQSLLSFFAPHDIDKLRLFMCVAASHGDAEVVQMLIDVCDRVYVSIVNDSIERGWTALHYAAYLGHAEVVRILIAALANDTSVNLSGDTPLHLAAKNGHTDVVEILLQHGDHLLTRGGKILIRFDHNILIDARGEYGRKPLHSTLAEYGISERRLAILNLLLKAKADVNARADNLETPLHCAASFDHGIAVKALLGARADKDAQDDQGRTPLYIATRCGHVKVVQALIAARANMLLRDSEGKTLFRFLHEGAERERRRRQPCFDSLIRTRKREVAQTLAASLHDRIGAQSPTGLLPQFILQELTQLAVDAEMRA
jgi:ankyrin repeat protein